MHLPSSFAALWKCIFPLKMCLPQERRWNDSALCLQASVLYRWRGAGPGDLIHTPFLQGVSHFSHSWHGKMKRRKFKGNHHGKIWGEACDTRVDVKGKVRGRFKRRIQMWRDSGLGKILWERRRTVSQYPARHWWRVRAKYKRHEYRIDVCQHKERKLGNMKIVRSTRHLHHWASVKVAEGRLGENPAHHGRYLNSEQGCTTLVSGTEFLTPKYPNHWPWHGYK